MLCLQGRSFAVSLRDCTWNSETRQHPFKDFFLKIKCWPQVFVQQLESMKPRWLGMFLSTFNPLENLPSFVVFFKPNNWDGPDSKFYTTLKGCIKLLLFTKTPLPSMELEQVDNCVKNSTAKNTFSGRFQPIILSSKYTNICRLSETQQLVCPWKKTFCPLRKIRIFSNQRNPYGFNS